MKLSVRSPEELVAAIPHLLGFTPHESLVVVPFTPGLPVARLDIPTSVREREHAWDSIHGVYARHAQHGSAVGLVALTTDRDHADRVGQDFTLRFATLGINTPVRLWTDDFQWGDLNSGISGPLTTAVRDSVAARTVLGGLAQPAPSRDSLADSLIGDPAAVAALLPEARDALRSSAHGVETDFALNLLSAFHDDGNRLTDRDAARLLVAMARLSIRDEVWQDMSQANALSHIALWSDLTRRAPDDVKAAPATMLAFASWLHGNGALAWCALDHVPHHQRYSAAELITTLLQNGLHPKAWDSIRVEIATARTRDLDQPTARSTTRPAQLPPTI